MRVRVTTAFVHGTGFGQTSEFKNMNDNNNNNNSKKMIILII